MTIKKMNLRELFALTCVIIISLASLIECQCQYEQDVDYYGNDLSIAFYSTQDLCCAACQVHDILFEPKQKYKEVPFKCVKLVFKFVGEFIMSSLDIYTVYYCMLAQKSDRKSSYLVDRK